METKIQLAAPAHVPSLSTSAMLCHLSIGAYSFTKKDRAASAKLVADNNVEPGLARAHKTLITSPKLDAIRTFVTRAHEINRNMTCDWMGKLRLLPAPLIPDHQRTMDKMEKEFERYVDDFGSDYAWLEADMQLKLGKMYDPTEYLPWEQLRRKFYFSVSYMPMPKEGDWRLDVSKETEEALREHYERRLADAMTDAMTDVWDRVRKMLEGDGDKDAGMLGALRIETDAEGKVHRGRIYDTRIAAAKDLISMLGALNIAGDPKMNLVQQRLMVALDGIDTRTDLQSDEMRIRLAEKLEAVKDSLPTLGGW